MTKNLLITLSIIFCSSLSLSAETYESAKAAAEQLYSQKSYALAHKAYSDLQSIVPDTEKRWVAFRLADTLWRSEASSQTADDSNFQKALMELHKLANEKKRKKDRDIVWVEVQESLGDFYWIMPRRENWSQAWMHYQLTFDWWAGSRDIDTARQRYIQLIYKTTSSSNRNDFRGYRQQLPIEIVENFKKISQTDSDKAYAGYLLALALRGGDNERAIEEFQNAINFGNKSDWYDDALFEYGMFLLQGGKIIEGENGETRIEPDYVKALEIFRRLTQEFSKGQTRYWEQAAEQIKQITNPELNINVSNIFLPDSEIQYFINARNLKTIELNLWQVDLSQDVRLNEGEVYNWVKTVDLKSAKSVKTWTLETQNKNEHKPFSKQERMEKLPIGAYILEAKGDNVQSRDLVLVTDVTLVVKTSSKQALAYFCDAATGKPIPKAKIKLWEGKQMLPMQGEAKQNWKETSPVETNDDGIAIFQLSPKAQPESIFAVAQQDHRQAFTLSNAPSCGFAAPSSWKIFAETDRPVYRPQETVQWKITARIYDGQNYSTPAAQKISYKILDPRGNEIKNGEATLNAFGSFWSSVELTDTMPLGEYQISFSSSAKEYFGSAQLFRLEEYKLPEFKVSVQTPQKDGKKIAFRLGEKIKADIQADYYFGGAVSNAQVEVVVYQKPFYRVWHPQRNFPWLYQDMDQSCPPDRGGPEQIIKREKIKTDSSGKAQIEFETPRSYNQDIEYRIEAHVTDSSRREIIASDTIKVSRQRYFVTAEPEGYLHQPSDKITVKFRALDVNDQPQQVEGDVKITRDYWYEIWISPEGKEVRGNEFPKTQPLTSEWKLKFRGYEHEEIASQKTKTNAEGEAELTFTPGKEGYYHLAWNSPDQGGRDVKADAVVWAATDQTTELGYRSGGVEIIADKDTFQVGQKAPVMISTNASDRYVLFSVEADDLLSYQLIHVEGTAKLIQLDIQEKHTPNIFLNANMVSQNQLFQDTKQIIIPPQKNFLNIAVKPDKEESRPGTPSEFTLTTTDSDGKPISAELSFALVDDSVFYIQKDYAPDIRQFFFGDKKEHLVQTNSAFQQRPYIRLSEKEEEQRQPPMPPIPCSKPFFARNQAMDTGAFGGAMMKSESAMRSIAPSAPPMMQGSAGNFAANEAMSARDSMMSSAPVSTLGAPAPMPASPSHQIQVRSDFRSTVFWQPDVKTDNAGQAKIKITYPDSTTTWKAAARAVTAANQFGVADVKTHTQKPLIVRLQAPRFFIVGDEVSISGVINNNTDKTLSVRPIIEVADVKNGEPVAKNENARPAVDIAAHGETRVDWRVKIEHPGKIKLRLTADAIEESDAMEVTYTVYERGIEKLLATSGKMEANELSVSLDLPKERRSTAFNIEVAPSMAVTMLDALPYLIDYPYGCVEQTMDRFLPAIVVAKTLQDLGLSSADISHKIFGGIEKEHVDKTHPEGEKDLEKLHNITSQSLEELYDAQQADGSWGWWKGNKSDPFMTAYVLWGLTLAQKSGIEVKADTLQRAQEFLSNALVNAEQDIDLQTWLLHSLASSHPSPNLLETKALENIWNNREKLNAYTRSLLALTLYEYGDKTRAQVTVQNLANGVKVDSAPDQSVLENKKSSSDSVIPTAHWGEDGVYNNWSDGGVEATAFALRAMLAVDPKNELIEPATNWLIKNRRGAQWSNTRDTTIAVLSLDDYLKASGELKTNLEYELTVNDQLVTTQKITPQDILKAPSRFGVDESLIHDGANTIHLKKKGEGNLYFAAYAKFFSEEKPIKSAGNEIFVKREYFKKKAIPTLLKGFVYENQLLKSDDELKSGDRVEVVITLEAKNNYEYLVFEDLKPAGLEAVQLRSGDNVYAKEFKSNAIPENISDPEEPDQGNMPTPMPLKRMRTKPMPQFAVAPAIFPPIPPRPPDDVISDFTGRTILLHQELRDRKVAFFIDKLPQGVWQIRYELRAEVPGKFSALPTLGHAMYVPEIRCNSDEISISVGE